MTVHWNAKRDLDLLGRLIDRELAERDLDRAGGVGRSLTLTARENNQLNADISLPLTLARGTKINLTAVASAVEMDLDDIFALAGQFAEAIDEVESQKRDVVEAASVFRSHVRKRVAKHAKRGLRLSGEVGIGRVGVDEAADMWPVVTLHFPGEDLRPCSISFQADDVEDIDQEVANRLDAIASRSAMLDDLEAVGAAGMISPVVHEALDRCEGGAAATIQRILANPLTHQDLEDANGERLVIYWHDGVMTGTIPVGPGVRFQKNQFLFDRLPRPRGEVEIGAPLSIVLDLPGVSDLGAEIISVSCSDDDERASIKVAFEPRLFRSDGTIL